MKSRFGFAAITLALTTFHATTAFAFPVISEVYGGGGNPGAQYQNDFIELYNSSAADVSLEGWSVQYSSAGGSGWQVVGLAGQLAAGKFYLVQLAPGVGGTLALPAPDAFGSVAMSAITGIVALVSNTTPLPCATTACSSGIRDFVGYGSSASMSEISPTSDLSNTTSAQRNGGLDTNYNFVDFTIGSPNPESCGIACHPAPVPLPAAVWLMLSGLGGVGAFARRRRSRIETADSRVS
jgi:uncharacterized protein